MVIKTIKKAYSDYKEDDAANKAISDAIQEKRDKVEKEIVEKNNKKKEDFRKASEDARKEKIQKKYAAAERIRGNSKTPTENITNTEGSSDITSTEGSFKKGGLVKKVKCRLIKGYPKIAKRGY